MRYINSNTNKPSFIHIRNYDEKNNIMNHGGITVAYRDSNTHNDLIEVAIAKCIWYENFSRKIGRTIAEGHLKYCQFHLLKKLDDKEKQYQQIIDFVLQITDEQEKLAQANIEIHNATVH